MALVRFAISDFRNIERAEIKPAAGVNLLVGANGSGKTSVLEAIHFLGFGRSFRTNHTGRVIRRHASRFVLFAEEQQADRRTAIGLIKSRQGETQLKIGGERAVRQSQLAEVLPLQVIHPDSFELLQGGPKFRRAFIDWGVFHVEQAFLSCWMRVRRALKQRNTLLRQGRSYQQIRPWDQEFVRESQLLTTLRGHYVDSLRPILQQICRHFLSEYEFDFVLSPGWDPLQELQVLLASHYERDRQQGYTQWGPHKADLKIRADGVMAAELLSRGQQKLLVSALKLAQGIHLSEQRHKQCIYLIDDFASELDEHKRQLLASALLQMGAQVFVTAIRPEQLPEFMSQDSNLFHVEQGNITEYN